MYIVYKDFVKEKYLINKIPLIERRTSMEPGGIVLVALIAILAFAAFSSRKNRKQQEDDQ